MIANRQMRVRLSAGIFAITLLSAGIVGVSSSSASALTLHTVSSPDGQTSLTVTNESDGTLTYVVSQDGKSVLNTSRMGLVTSDVDLSVGLSYVGATTRTVNESYSLIERRETTSTSQANEMTLSYTKNGVPLQVVVQAHNDGVAFRYVMSSSTSKTITSESTTFNLPVDTGTWASRLRGDSTGHTDYEETYPYRSAEALGTDDYAFPVLGSLRVNTQWTLISEASVYNLAGAYPALHVVGSGNGNRTLLAKFPLDQTTPVVVNGPLTTPWRVVVATRNLQELTSTSLITDLNPPSKIADTSWIRPGRALWSWWSDNNSGDSLETQKRYVDSAEALGMQYVTVDCCWQTLTTPPTRVTDIPVVVEYAKARGIGIFIWIFATDVDTQAERDQLLPLWKSWGVKGLKVDFFNSDSQPIMGAYTALMEAAAANQLMLNFHGNTKPSGENRTYPNVITSEAVWGAEYYNFGRVPTAQHDAILPFTRNILGGMDATPVVISPGDGATTQAHQLALAVVFESAMLHFADSDATYKTWPGRHFMSAVPTVWNESRLVEGFPGDYATYARRSGGDWYIGAITNAARTASVPLNFLDTGTYTATIFKDGGAQQLAIEQRTVTAADTLSLPLLTHGGVSIHISRAALPLNGVADRTYEAEAAGNTLSGGAVVSSCPGCSGGKKVGYLGGAGTLSVNNVTAAAAGPHVLEVGFTTAEPRTLSVAVNGGAAVNYALPPASHWAGAWNNTATTKIAVNLQQGTNTIMFSNPSGNAPDIDRFVVSRSFEAEAPQNTRTGSTSVASCGPCSGGSKIGNLFGASTLTFTGVTASNSGSTTVFITYASADPRSAKIRVGNGPSIDVQFPATGGWNTPSVKTIALPLTVGTNTITIDSANGYAPDIDLIRVNQ